MTVSPVGVSEVTQAWTVSNALSSSCACGPVDGCRRLYLVALGFVIMY